jgi:hypothetical protein
MLIELSTAFRRIVDFFAIGNCLQEAYPSGRDVELGMVHDLPDEHQPGSLSQVSGCAGLAGIPIPGPHPDPPSAGTRLLPSESLPVPSERSSRRVHLKTRHGSGMSTIIASEAPSPVLDTVFRLHSIRPTLRRIKSL